MTGLPSQPRGDVQPTKGHPRTPATRVGVQGDDFSSEVETIFRAQQANQYRVASTSAVQRKRKLRRLHQAILTRRQDIRDALYADFGKHPSEVDLTEIYPVTGEIKHAVRHLRRWQRPHRVSTPLALVGSR